MKFLFLSLFLFIGTLCSAQTFIATHQSIRTYNPDKGYFNDWGEWYVNSDTIVLKVPQEKIAIYSKYPLQMFTILRPPIKEIKGDRDIIVLDCVNFEGERCILELVHYEGKGEQLYIR